MGLSDLQGQVQTGIALGEAYRKPHQMQIGEGPAQRLTSHERQSSPPAGSACRHPGRPRPCCADMYDT